MGVMNHNAIVATTASTTACDAWFKWMVKLPETDQERFLIGPDLTNGYRTVVLVPDGSKEGWGESSRGDDLRAAFIDHLQDFKNVRYTPWEWVEVGFGEFGQAVLGGNNRNCYDDMPYACPDHIRPYTPRSDDEEDA